jgi:heptosyltransferase-2
LVYLGLVVNKGSEGLFNEHPYLNKLYIQDKKNNKYRNVRKILMEVRKEHYDYVINVNRFGSAGMISAFSGARIKIGFDKSPFSFSYNIKVRHLIGKQWPVHETMRNHELLKSIAEGPAAKPRLYPSASDFDLVSVYKRDPYITIAPISLWYTKQYPEECWIEFIKNISPEIFVYLLGSEKDKKILDLMLQKTGMKNVFNLAGKLDLLQSAALIKDAKMNFANDSAPVHLASAMNAPVTAVFCSTIPEFGFGPLSDDSAIIQTEEYLKCRPCGLHGYNKCPENTMACAYTILVTKFIERIKQ